LPSEQWPHVVVLEPASAGLALSRTMTRLGARVTLVVSPWSAEDAKSRRAESVIAPYEPNGRPWLAAIQEIAAIESRPIVVVTATDRGSELLVRAAPELPSHVHVFEGPDSAHMALMDKERADPIARRAGVNVPWTAEMSDWPTFERLAGEAPWPCVVKPVFSHEWREKYTLERTFLAADAEEARRLLARPLDDGFPMLLSQYIPGGDDHVEEAIVVRLADGSYPMQFGCRKLRQWPPGFGETAVGESQPLPETTEIAKKVLDEAGFVGVAGVEVKRHAETGERWFLEVNVRCPGQWGLGDACGAEASERLVRALAGMELGPAAVGKPGVRMVLPDIDARILLPALKAVPVRRRPALAARMLRPYWGARELGVFDPRDPGPGLAMLGIVARRRVKRLLARASS
jgi:predicted ATP-grasp superfamily ATP-dependent carboligase